jgi:peptidoglycan/xylan/chitin deacetylase (PgdA/CDA1 family)
MFYAQKREINSILRSAFKTLGGNFAALLPFSFLLKISGQKQLLPFYHYSDDSDALHLKHLYPARSPELFEKDLDFILKYYQPIDLARLISINKGENAPPSKPYFHLSFDDGLSQCSTIIAPILLKKGIPATFFLNSAFIDNRDLMFRYKISLCIEAFSKLTTEKQKQILDYSKNYFKNENLASAQYDESAEIDKLAADLNIDFQDYLTKTKPYMDSEEISGLIQQGFTIGSHSIDHPLYKNISLDEQIRQTLTSQHFIENKFNIPYRVFAFPFSDYGVKKDFFNAIFEKEGFDLCFGTAGLKKDSISGNLQRFPLEGQKLDSARKMLATEYLYYFFKMPFGKNLIKRS